MDTNYKGVRLSLFGAGGGSGGGGRVEGGGGSSSNVIANNSFLSFRNVSMNDK